MKSTIRIQKDGVNTLKDEIMSHSNKSLKKIYILASDIKETGYDVIEECLIDLKARKFIVFGIDKKNTTRKMLENILKYTKNVYIWDNNSEVEFNSNIYVFEYEEEAQVYIVSGSVTDSLLETDIVFYTKLTYDLIKDKKEYEEYIDALVREVKQSFVKLSKEYIDTLAEEKLIFTTKQYMHVVPSIAELLGKTEKEEKPEEKPQELPKIQLDESELAAFEIDLGDFEQEVVEVDVEDTTINNKAEEQEVEMEAFGLAEELIDDEEQEAYEISDEVIDMESMVLESKVVKINKNDIVKTVKKEKKEAQDKQASKKINLSKVSNIIMELAKKPTKGKDINKIKIPNYIKDIIPQFFEVMEDAKLLKSEIGEYKEAKIKLEIIDVNTSNKYVDTAACIRQKVGQTYIEFESDKFENIMYEEMDIARVIKLAKDSYYVEIIPQGIEEYNLWDKLCTNSFRGSSRQYGLM